MEFVLLAMIMLYAFLGIAIMSGSMAQLIIEMYLESAVEKIFARFSYSQHLKTVYGSPQSTYRDTIITAFDETKKAIRLSTRQRRNVARRCASDRPRI
jgi:hypothetical protein